MKFNLISAASGLLRYHLDNIIYRREIGMDTFGRLRTSSPIIKVHGMMLACSVAVGIVFYSRQWELLLSVSSGLIVVMALAAYPVAYYRAFKSFHNERVQGTLEQIYLTSLRPQEIFDGKFYGTLAPFFEAKRYFIGFCFCAVYAVYQLRDPMSAAYCIAESLSFLNVYGFFAYRGILGGIKSGAQRNNFWQAIFTDGETNPILSYIGIAWFKCFGQNLRILVVVALSYFFSYWIWAIIGPIAFVIPGLVACLIPIGINQHLASFEASERERFMRGFRKVFNFEATLDAKEEGKA